MDSIWSSEKDEKLRSLHFQGRSLDYMAFEFRTTSAAIWGRLSRLGLAALKGDYLFPENLSDEYVIALKSLYPHYYLRDIAACVGRKTDYVSASIGYLTSKGILSKCSYSGPPKSWSRQDYYWLFHNAEKFSLEDIACELDKRICQIRLVLLRRGLRSKDQWEEAVANGFLPLRKHSGAVKRKWRRSKRHFATDEEISRIIELFPYFDPDDIARRLKMNKSIVRRAVRNLADKNILDKERTKAYFPPNWTFEEFRWFIQNVGNMTPHELAGRLKRPVYEVRWVIRFSGNGKIIRGGGIQAILERALELRADHSTAEISRRIGKPLKYIEGLFSRYDLEKSQLKQAGQA